MAVTTETAVMVSEKSASANGNLLVKTVNNMGFQYLGPPDDYVEDFIRFAATADGPVADLGCAFGRQTRLMLEAGAKSVIANDLAQAHLDALADSLTDGEKARVTLQQGNALDFLSDIQPLDSLSGILAAMWLHFLEGPDVRRAFQLFYRVLQPGGTLVVITGSHQNGLIVSEKTTIAERKAAGNEWPGRVENSRLNYPVRVQFPGHVLFIEPEELVREARSAGFEILRAGYIERDESYPEWYRMDGREAAGLHALKPK
ncbi:hypothetical protein BV898_10667 [Hypsibius exemplaris]|uniref:Methyltransferase domain-containing protein n=1 Tax=Hypsibius exemplaris TaxID=2072580 RepID=A0A1W0WJ47_HYPEX|nr:hypothetical protein BV898_10667 [Hypsibius exemplaris]